MKLSLFADAELADLPGSKGSKTPTTLQCSPPCGNGGGLGGGAEQSLRGSREMPRASGKLGRGVPLGARPTVTAGHPPHSPPLRQGACGAAPSAAEGAVVVRTWSVRPVVPAAEAGPRTPSPVSVPTTLLPQSR